MEKEKRKAGGRNKQDGTNKGVDRIEKKYGAGGKVTKVDGLSIEFDKWRFNLRMSNTEPVIRLNVETRQDVALLKEKTDELLAEIRA